MYYSNAFRGISPWESYLCAKYRATGIVELMERTEFKPISPDVHRGKVVFLKWRHILIRLGSRNIVMSPQSLGRVFPMTVSPGTLLKERSQCWQPCQNILSSSPYIKFKLLRKSLRKITISFKILKYNSVESQYLYCVLRSADLI